MANAKPAAPLPDQFLERLISHGYFPTELPPTFTTADYSKHVVEFSNKWVEKDIWNFWSTPESYSSPRYGHARRKLAIVNPVNQLLVAKLISQNWSDVETRLKRSKISEFRPEILLKGSGRAVTGVDFDGVSRRRAEILGSYGRYVRTDVARFYPSIYTHSIAWAIVGKAYAKAHHHDAAFKASFANKLDAAVRSGQEGQTLGIPIGPDTSRIISELIAVEVEILARKNISNFDDRGVRYVDDMMIGLEEAETAAAVLSALSTALYEYGLELNAEKTITLGLGSPHAPEWINYVRSFEIGSKSSRQRDDLDSFFEQAVYLSDANPRENVLLFSAKRAATFKVEVENVGHLVRWLLYAARRSPSCLRFVSEHLAAIHDSPGIPSAEINKYILNQIPVKAQAAHIEEVAWLLFWAREIKLPLTVQVLESVKTLHSSTIALLVLDLQDKSLIIGTLDTSFWESFATTDGLKSDMWLVSYEATKKGWWGSANAYITGHQFFNDIWTKGIEFYDPKKKARDTAKAPFLTRALAKSVGSRFGSPEYPY